MSALMSSVCDVCRRRIFRFLYQTVQPIRFFRKYSGLTRRPCKYSRWTSRFISSTIDPGAEKYFQKRIKIKTGSLARFADGAAVVEYENTGVLVTVVGSNEVSSSNFLPLTVDYRQKAAAAGRIPTNHLRRELGPSDKEILTSRLIDRSIRPMFPPGYNKEVQVTSNILAMDGVNDPDVVSINAASAALWISDIPWNGPIGAVRIGIYEGKESPEYQLRINPTRLEQQENLFNIIVVANQKGDIVMLEGDGDNVSVIALNDIISQGKYYAKVLANLIARDCLEFQKQKRTFVPPFVIPKPVTEAVESSAVVRVNEILSDKSHDKISRDTAINQLRHTVAKELSDQFPEDAQLIHEAYSILVRQALRNQILDHGVRCDGRSVTEVRPITSEVDLYKPLHGSALFQRGQTQVLCTVTFDSLESASKSDPVSVMTGALQEKNFMLHYEFPSFSINEIKKTADRKGRRELGHGALAEKALRPVIPDNYPFCIRLTSEVLQSNGSSSMASVCGGSLALMDAGVPIKPLAGVAMGLVTRRADSEITDFAIMTDILGIEDYAGDMDFKIAGSHSGFTALQLDLKIPGVPMPIIKTALNMSLEHGLTFILTEMEKTITEPRKGIKTTHPVVENLTILPSERSRFLGLGGYNLRKLRSDTGVTITPVDESNYQIFAPNQSAMDEAKDIIKELLEEKKVPDLQFNAIYQAKITEIRDIGVMVQLHPSMEPVLLHNSQLDHRPVSHPSSLGFEVGQIISVKYYGRDPASGRVRISRKVITAPTSKAINIFKDENTG